MEASEFSTTSLRDILYVIFKRKALILLFFFITFATVAIGTFLVKPTYEARAQILVKLGRESVFIPATGNVGPIVNYSSEERINSEIEIIKSQSLAKKVVLVLGPTLLYEDLKNKKPSLTDRIKNFIFPNKKNVLTPEQQKALTIKRATLRLEKNLEIENIKKSAIIQIKFKHHNPRLVAIVVNRLASEYLEHHLDVYKKPGSYTFFQEQANLSKARLEKVEEAFKDLKKRNNITSLAEERTLLLAQVSSLRSAINVTASQLVETQKRIARIRRQFATTPKTISQGEVIDRNEQLISRLESRLVELQLKEKEFLNKYTEQSRLVQNVKKEIELVHNKLAEQKKMSYGTKSSGANPTYLNLQQELFHNEAELNALRGKKEIQKKQLLAFRSQLEKLNQLEVKLNELQQQIDVDRQNYRLYLAKFEESRISAAMDAEKIASVSLIEPAHVPLKPVSPKKMLNLLLALFLGAFGGLGLAFFMEYLNDNLEKTEDVEKYLHLPVLASIPELKKVAAAHDGSMQFSPN